MNGDYDSFGHRVVVKEVRYLEACGAKTVATIVANSNDDDNRYYKVHTCFRAVFKLTTKCEDKQ